MPLYEFRCSGSCGVAERHFAMADVPHRVTCPCGATSERVFSAVRLAADSAVIGLLDATASTAEQPRTVSAPAPVYRRRRRPVSTDPRHRRLPRP